MKEKRKQKEPITAILLITLSFILLAARILYVDVTQGDLMPRYRDPEIETEFYRGTIFAEDGNILALDVPTYYIRFSGKPIREPARIASLVAPFTDLDPLFIERLLKNNQGTDFSIPSTLASSSRDLFRDLIEKEHLENLISIEKVVERQYPFRNHGEFLIGRTHDSVGISGCELIMDEELQAPLSFSNALSKGRDQVLAIDMELQYAAETVMRRLSPKPQTYSLLTVLDRNTLEILALDQTPMKDVDCFELLEALLDNEVSITSSDEVKSLPGSLPSVIDGEYVFHHFTDMYLIISISSNEKTASSTLGTFNALLESRNMI